MEHEKQAIIDSEHLRLLAMFHYISGAMTLLFSGLFLLQLLVFKAIAGHVDHTRFETGQDEIPIEILNIFMIGFTGITMFGVLFGIAQIVSGVFLAKRKNWLFSFIVALPNAFMIPYGTMLAIFTLIVLDRPSVKAIYGKQPDRQGSSVQH